MCGTIVEHELQQLGPGVVADRVHHALALDDEVEIEIGDQHAFALGQRRHDMGAFGRDDRRHAAAVQRLAQLFVGRDFRDLLFGEPAGGVDDEAAALERVVADRHLDLLGEDRPDQRSGKLRDVNFLVLRHQRVAGEGIVVLPAGERADTADGGVDDGQPAPSPWPQIIRSWNVGVILRRLRTRRPSASKISCVL